MSCIKTLKNFCHYFNILSFLNISDNLFTKPIAQTIIKLKMDKQSEINIRNLILQQLLFELNQQYQSSTFEINRCLRNAFDKILKDKQIFHVEMKEEQSKEIKSQLTLFVFSFIKAPSVWAQLLENDEIEAKGNKIIINGSQTLTHVYREIIKQTNHLIDQQRAKLHGNKTTDQQTQQALQALEPFDFQYVYMNHSTKAVLADLLNNVADQICTFYNEGKNLIIAQQKKVEQQIKSSQIMNQYYLFGMLKQMSSYTYKKLEEAMSEYFKSIPSQTISVFCRYVQKNYELVELQCNKMENKIYTDEELKKYIEQQNQFWLNFLKNLENQNLTLKKVKSTKGDTAVMIVKPQDNKDNGKDFEQAQKLIMNVGANNKIKVTNSKISQKKWAVFDMKDSVSGIYKVLKQQLKNEASDKVKEDIIAYGVPIGQYSNLGSNVGKCLANINQYKSANQFLMDLSKSTVIGGSMGYILSQIPILSYFIIAGGLTYTFYHTFSNKATSYLKKFKQIGKSSVTAVGAVGSSVAGMMIGQSLIPIPFLGAFIGGVIGGFLGTTGSNQITKLMNKESFNHLIKFLLKNIIEETHWKFTQKLLQRLGISYEYFTQQICPKQSQRDSYITAICFCIVAFHETKRYSQRNSQKMKQLQKKQKQLKSQKDKKQLLQQQQQFDSEFDIVGIVDYLTQHNVVLLLEHDKLQNCIRHLII